MQFIVSTTRRLTRASHLFAGAAWPWLLVLGGLLGVSFAYWVQRADATLPLGLAQRLVYLGGPVSVGCALGLAGASWQALTRQSNASPWGAGLNAAAVLGGLTASIYLPTRQATPWLYDLGVVGAAALAAGLAGVIGGRPTGARPPHRGTTPMGIGVMLRWAAAVAALHGSALTSAVPQPTFWLCGDFHAAGSRPWGIALAVGACAALRLATLHREVAHMQVGHLWARQAGVPDALVGHLALAAICLLVAAATSVAGGVMGLCLAGPRLARALVGDLPRHMWPLASLLGGLFALWTDGIVRVWSLDGALPLTVVLAPLTALSMLPAARRSGFGDGTRP
jgi:iron complex transport system permease protein